MAKPAGNHAPALVWFRDDLRLADQPALMAAINSGRPVVCLFLHDEGRSCGRSLGGAQLWWLHHSLAALSASLAKIGGRLDILMNCAGGSLVEDVPVHKMDLAVFERTIALNLRHPFLCCRHGIPHMLASGGGSIINSSTWLALIGQEKPIYAAAKGGIVAFTRTLATEYMKDGIRANAIAPATVRTERSIARWENPESGAAKPSAETQARNAANRKLYPFSVGEPEHIAAIAVFLGSDESRMLTGITIPADGGRSSYLKVAVD